MTALAPLLRALLTRGEPVGAGAGRGRQGLDAARGRHRACWSPPSATHGTIGGGRLEWEAIAARARAAGERRCRRRRIAAAARARRSASAAAATSRCGCGAPVAADCRRARGDRGAASASGCRWCCCSAPATSARRSPARWRRCRCGCAGSTAARDEFPDPPLAGPEVVVTERWLAEVEAAPAGAAYFVMTHSHALDFEICEAVLRRGDFAYLGLIGSRTKRAQLRARLARARPRRRRRSTRLVCPIGGAGSGTSGRR